MTSFSIVRAATFGFRFIRERPKLFWTWFGVQFAVYVLVVTLVAAVTWYAGETALGALLMLPLVIAGGVLYFVQMTAIFRAVLRPDEGRRAYYRLGRDELRQLLLFVVLGLAVVLVAAVIVGILFGISALRGGGWSAPGTVPWGIFAVIALPLVLAVWLAIIRLSLVGPATFDQGRIDLRFAWRLTKGLFWKLVGCFLIVALLTLPIQLPGVLLEFILDRAFIDAGGAGVLVGLGLNLMVQAAVSAVLTPIIVTPAAYIYSTLTAPKA
jgi:hypothetical protein